MEYTRTKQTSLYQVQGSHGLIQHVIDGHVSITTVYERGLSKGVADDLTSS